MGLIDDLGLCYKESESGYQGLLTDTAIQEQKHKYFTYIPNLINMLSSDQIQGFSIQGC